MSIRNLNQFGIIESDDLNINNAVINSTNVENVSISETEINTANFIDTNIKNYDNNSIKYGVKDGLISKESLGLNDNVTSVNNLLCPDNINNVKATLQIVPSIIYIASSSTLDNPSGTGARKIIIEGVDISGNLINEIVELNGQSVVNTINVFNFINQVVIFEAGTLLVNDGFISFGDNLSVWVNGSTSRFFNIIPPNIGISKCLAIMTASSFFLQYKDFYINNDATSNKPIFLNFNVRVFNPNTSTYLLSNPIQLKLTSGFQRYNGELLKLLPPLSIFYITCNSASTSFLSVTSQYVMIDVTKFPNVNI